jgi:hypothetical protein
MFFAMVNYGSDYPKPRPVSGGWAIPLGITVVTDDDGNINHTAYEVTSLTLFPHDIDAAVGGAGDTLPPADYSSDIHAAVCHGIRLQRAAEYPPASDYLDGVAKGDQEQIDSYIAACLAVKERYPFPEQS